MATQNLLSISVNVKKVIVNWIIEMEPNKLAVAEHFIIVFGVELKSVNDYNLCYQMPRCIFQLSSSLLNLVYWTLTATTNVVCRRFGVGNPIINCLCVVGEQFGVEFTWVARYVSEPCCGKSVFNVCPVWKHQKLTIILNTVENISHSKKLYFNGRIKPIQFCSKDLF